MEERLNLVMFVLSKDTLCSFAGALRSSESIGTLKCLRSMPHSEDELMRQLLISTKDVPREQFQYAASPRAYASPDAAVGYTIDEESGFMIKEIRAAAMALIRHIYSIHVVWKLLYSISVEKNEDLFSVWELFILRASR